MERIIETKKKEMALRIVVYDPPAKVKEAQDTDNEQKPQSSKWRGKKKQPAARPPRKSNIGRGSSKRAQPKTSIASTTKEPSFIATVIDVLEAYDPSKKFDYDESAEAYKNYWKNCMDAYIRLQH